MKHWLLIAALALAPSGALAQQAAPKHTSVASSVLLNAVALNASAATRTFTITNPKGGYAIANLELARTRVAGTDMTMTCVSTVQTGVTPAAQRGTCTYDASGVCTHLQATWKSSTSSTETLAWQVNILGWTRTDCVVASTSAGASDLITVTGNMVTQ